MPYLIRSAGGERTAFPVGSKRSATVIREDLVEALKGLTIRFELKISDVIIDDPNSSKNCDNGLNRRDFESDSNDDTSSAEKISSEAQKIPPRLNEPSNGPSNIYVAPKVVQENAVITVNTIKEEFPSKDESESRNGAIDYKQPIKPSISANIMTNDCKEENETVRNQEFPQSNSRPKLVNSFKSNIRPVSSLRPDSGSEKSRSTLNFTPLQVLRKQVEIQVNKPRVRPTFVDPLGSKVIHEQPPEKCSPNVICPARNGRSDTPSASTNKVEAPVLSPKLESAPVEAKQPEETKENNQSANVEEPIELSNRSFRPGKLQVGSTTTTCFLSDGTGDFSYIPYSSSEIIQITKMLKELAVEIETLPRMRSVKVFDAVFAKSLEDDIWYRAVVNEVDESTVSVFYVDWGTLERLDLGRVRFLSISRLSLTARPPCAVKAKFTNDPQELDIDNDMKVIVNSYDELGDIYSVTAIN